MGKQKQLLVDVGAAAGAVTKLGPNTSGRRYKYYNHMTTHRSFSCNQGDITTHCGLGNDAEANEMCTTISLARQQAKL